MIKVIETKGKHAQEVQDYFDKCVDEGAVAKYGVNFTSSRYKYSCNCTSNHWKYAGVDLGGRTFFSDTLDTFLELPDILNLLDVRDAAKKVVISYSSDDDLYDALGGLEEVLNL